MENNKKNLTTIQFASKWWADRLDGTINDVRLDKQFLKRVVLEKIFNQELVSSIDEFVESCKTKKEKAISVYQLFPAERKKFEEELTKILEKEIKTNQYVDLCVDEDGAQLALAWAAERAEIDIGQHSAFAFAPFVEMLVGKDDVEIRFNENDNFETIFKVDKDNQLNDENNETGI